MGRVLQEESSDSGASSWTTRLKRTLSRTPESVPRCVQIEVATGSLNFTRKETLKETIKVHNPPTSEQSTLRKPVRTDKTDVLLQLEDIETTEADALSDKSQVLILKSKKEVTLEFSTPHDLQLFRQVDYGIRVQQQ